MEGDLPTFHSALRKGEMMGGILKEKPLIQRLDIPKVISLSKI